MPEQQAPQSIRDAIAEAVEGSEYVAQLDEGLDNLDELVTTADAPDPGAADESQTGDEPGTVVDSGAPDGGTEDEPPDSYWGTSLEGYSPEQRREIIAALEQRDSVIHKLQQQLAQEPPAPEAAPAAVDEPELTDDDILRVLGVDPETSEAYEVEMAKKIGLPLAKQVIALEETVEKISNTEQAREISGFWNSTLDKLEAEYGPLPGDRVQVLQHAVREQITDPEVLYFRLTAGPRKAIDAELAKARQNVAKKVAQGGLRPQARQGGDRVISKDKSLRDTVREAAMAAQEESGFRWADQMRKR